MRDMTYANPVRQKLWALFYITFGWNSAHLYWLYLKMQECGCFQRILGFELRMLLLSGNIIGISFLSVTVYTQRHHPV